MSHGLIKSFLLMALSFLLITACNISESQRSNISIEHERTVADCQVVEHTSGETCIPLNPQRIVALDYGFILDSLLALDVKPVGIAVEHYRGKLYLGGLTSNNIAGLEVVGSSYQPSLEKILTVKPDLILGIDFHQQYYKQLSAIAPTVLFANFRRTSFREDFRTLAQLVDQEEKVDKVFNQYQERVETLKNSLKDELKEKEVSVIVYGGGNFAAPYRYMAFFDILNDIGMTIKPIFRNQEEWSTFSIEAFDEYAADILFIADADEKPVSFFLEHPIISKTKAAQNNRLYIVESNIWQSSGPSAVHRILDDIEKHLLDDA